MSDKQIHGKVSFFRVVQAIGKVTFLEILREKVLYNVLMATFLLFGLSFLASKFTYIQPERMVLDFGYLALSLSSLFLATMMGAGLISKEFERRTAHVALSHPISTYHFVFGKYWGLVQILIANWFLLVLAYLLLLFGQKGYFNWNVLSFTFFSAIWLALIQGFVLGAIALVFASFSTTSLSVILSAGVYLVGINASELRLLSARVDSQLGQWILKGAANALPNFEHFNLGVRLTYDLPVSSKFVIQGSLYGVFIVLFCLMLSGLLLRVKAK